MERRNPPEWAAFLRQDVLKMAMDAERHTGERLVYPAEAFSVVEILVVLYLEILSHRPENPSWPVRDRFLLGKRTAWPAYRALLCRLGYFLRELSPDQPLDMNAVPGVDFSSTADGSSLPAGVGMAIGLKMDLRPPRVFALLAGSDLQSGGTWEAAGRAGQEKLSSLCAIVDQCAEVGRRSRDDTKEAKDIAETFRAFGWESLVIDGHSVEEVRYAFSKFKKNTSGRPYCLVARTLSGRG